MIHESVGVFLLSSIFSPMFYSPNFMINPANHCHHDVIISILYAGGYQFCFLRSLFASNVAHCTIIRTSFFSERNPVWGGLQRDVCCEPEAKPSIHRKSWREFVRRKKKVSLTSNHSVPWEMNGAALWYWFWIHHNYFLEVPAWLSYCIEMVKNELNCIRTSRWRDNDIVWNNELTSCFGIDCWGPCMLNVVDLLFLCKVI